MASNTLQSDRATGQTVEAADVNEFRTALKGTFYVRDSTSRAPSHEADDICDATHRARRVYTKYLNLNGVDIDISAIKATGIDYVVNSLGGADYTTITGALAAAALAGGSKVILVLSGTYTEDINVSSANITLKGVGPQTNLSGNCVISGVFCTLERMIFGNAAKALSVQTTGNYAFIDKVWVNGVYGTNYTTDATVAPIVNIQFFTEE